MAKYTKKHRVSEQTQEEALKIARANQRPGQTKEQTKLIAQGIQKGIDQYKKQYKAKARELDRQLKRTAAQRREAAHDQPQPSEVEAPRRCVIPWVLLIVSWAGFLAFSLLR